MNKREIYHIINELQQKKNKFNDQSDLFKDLGFDSLTFIELIAAIEERSGINFDEINIFEENCSKVGNLCDFIIKTLREQQEITQ